MDAKPGRHPRPCSSLLICQQEMRTKTDTAGASPPPLTPHPCLHGGRMHTEGGWLLSSFCIRDSALGILAFDIRWGSWNQSPWHTQRRLYFHISLVSRGSLDTQPLFEFPEPYSKFPLALYFTYGNVSFHVTLSVHLSLSSFLPMSISLLSMNVSSLLS